MTQDNLDVTLPTLSYSTFSMGVYAANHMDLIFDAIKGNYELVGVHLDGKQLRIYCWAGTDQAVKICKALGAASTCQKDRQCDLTI